MSTTTLAFLRIPLFFSLCCTSLLLIGQTERIEKSFVLPKGEQAQHLQWTIPLPEGKIAKLESIAFAKTNSDGTYEELKEDVEVRSASAKTTLAGRKPYFYTTFSVSREDYKTDFVLRVNLEYSLENGPTLQARTGPQEPTASVLASGDIYKLSVDVDGIYQIDAALLNSLGLSANNPQQVRLFSKGGAVLPERVGDPYPVDLQEVALYEVGDGDSSWEEGEKFLFYGQGEDVWEWDGRNEDFTRKENPYSELTFYYLKVEGTGLRTGALPQGPAINSYDNTYTNRVRWEEDLVNILQFAGNRYGSGQGSGQQFFGYTFGTSREVRREGLWNLGTIVPGATGKLTARVAASALTNSTRFSVDVNGQTFTSQNIRQAVRGDANFAFAHDATLASSLALNTNVIDLTVTYPGTLESNPGWLDYVQLSYPCELEVVESPLFFRSANHSVTGLHGFELSGNTNVTVLDISDPILQKTVSVSGSRFSYMQEATGSPREFVAFDPTSSYPAPENIGKIENTNLHAISSADMLIIYGEDLQSSATRLAEHRRTFNGFTVEVASMADIAEEFGGGRFDPTSIRAFAKMIFDRDPNFRYIALVGDGTYDPRNIVERSGNLIPTYQTSAYNDEVDAFPTDDYYTLISEGDGRSDLTFPEGLIDISIGRIPANSVTQANSLIDKIIRYDADPDMLGEWRMRNVYVADDEDRDSHFNDMDGIAELNLIRFPELNQVKIYADAFEQVPTPGGIRIPRAAEAINQNMFRGNLTTSYLGHGGPRGWAQERILNAPDIEKWNSRNSFPILVTATCTFTGFDDPQKTVAGELVLFKRDGGAVASVSTTRPVFTTANRALTNSTHIHLFDKTFTANLGMGELLNLSKNSTAGNVQNNLKYSLFGDPAMKIAVPKLNVELTHFDSVLVATTTDTFSVAPLQEVTIQGIVSNLDGSIASDFNGEVILTIFDKERSLQTLGQDAGSSVRNYRAQGGTLFKGRATVANGRWVAKFRLPKDMSISQGLGRLSMYAFSPDGRDGGGLYRRFLLDGLASSTIQDDTPPIVEVFMGSDAFVSGAITSEDPVLLAKLSDDFGINVSGTSIGHDLSATLRGGQNGNFVLNDFYQSSADDYRSGEVRYPLFDLPEGEYELEVRAWDLSNNTGIGTTQFIVSNDAGVALKRVLNYPNPFVDATCFQFEHTAAGQFVEIQIDIYTTSGRLVRSLRQEGVAQGFRYGNDDCISWDGTDMFGQELARGVYLYKVKLQTEDAQRSGESGFERLVVLK